MSRIILASASKARVTLLRNAGVNFSSVPANLDEAAMLESLATDDAAPEDVAQILAEAKAAHISTEHQDALVIGADQVLTSGGEIFSKPQSIAKAYEQLWRLRGRTHQLHSAVACARHGETLFRYCDTAELHMRPFSREFLARYLEEVGDMALSSVGGYQLEGYGIQLFDSVQGDYFTILGLPLLPLLDYLRNAGEIVE